MSEMLEEGWAVCRVVRSWDVDEDGRGARDGPQEGGWRGIG